MFIIIYIKHINNCDVKNRLQNKKSFILLDSKCMCAPKIVKRTNLLVSTVAGNSGNCNSLPSIAPRLTLLRLVCLSICSQIYFNFYFISFLFCFCCFSSVFSLSWGALYISRLCYLVYP